MLNCYRRFIRQVAHILAPLVKFLEGIKNKKRSKQRVKIKLEEILSWTDETITAFEQIKETVAQATLLHHPIPNAPLSFRIDASDFGVGGALTQHSDNLWNPLAFLSMKLTSSQKKWSKYDRELLVIYTMMKRFRHMLEGREFTEAETSNQVFFKELSDLLGINRIYCCAYLQKANILVERLHRHFKSAIKAHDNSKCSEIIPIVLLGMRSAVKNEIQATCAELVYVTTLRLPSDIFSLDKISTTCNPTYVSLLRDKMASLQPMPTSNHVKSSVFVPTTLKSCSHVFLRVDSVQPQLSQPYTGPHEVVNRSDNVFVILINGKKEVCVH
ncbi:hypothetical protein AVEN_45901-1 [Araneus ventricosus]|uniref:Reverse transcriptase/retrotransposon-derived protein RNase H-like domain-containing protein n=1 Tax=Araneus ventricosus TaxID=182803 RepID=A0A4Y2EBN2_ARAVE|nr:hypothetical protein AVEN_45901-1 [Araneus ventricosus]